MCTPGGQLTFHTLKANWMSLADISKSSSTRNIAVKCIIVSETVQHWYNLTHLAWLLHREVAVTSCKRT